MMFMSLLLPVGLLVSLVQGNEAELSFDYTQKHCIVGAGPAGLQVGLMLQQADEDYVVLERSSGAGSFYNVYPKHDQLISINKKYTGSNNAEFNLRHDWNSLITSFETANGTEFSLSEFTEDYFPHRQVLVDYLGAFATKYDIRVHFNTNVTLVDKTADEAYFVVSTVKADYEGTKLYRCTKLIWAAGLSVPRQFKNPLYTPYHEIRDASNYKNKTVAIVGAGQSAFEVAKALYGKTASVMILYRRPPKFAWNTHYVGHLRAVNNEVLDAYQLKSLDALVELNDGKLNAWAESLERRPDTGKLFFRGVSGGRLPDFDVVISATGWKMDMGPFSKLRPRMSVQEGDRADRYPKLTGKYESTSITNLYFAGTISHGLDKGKSSGGFIHGFRYTSRALARILSSKPWPRVIVGCFEEDKTKDQAVGSLAQNMMDRFGSSSGLYQMFGELQDVYYFQDQCLYRFEEVPVRHVPDFVEQEPRISSDAAVFTMTFRYREGFSQPHRDVFASDRVVTPKLPPTIMTELAYQSLPNGWHEVNFLHPVLEALRYGASDCTRLLQEPFHLMEDLETTWQRPMDLVPLVEWLLVRTLSSPCLFDVSSKDGKLAQKWWMWFIETSTSTGLKTKKAAEPPHTSQKGTSKFVAPGGNIEDM
jgi:thioredoxin reductase